MSTLLTLAGVVALLVWHVHVSRPAKPMDRLLTAPPLPPAREDLAAPSDWPVRQSPTDLAAAYAVPIIPGSHAQSSVNPVGAYVARHSAGETTLEFARIVHGHPEYADVQLTHLGLGNRALLASDAT